MDRNTRLTQVFIGLMFVAAVAGTAWAGWESHTLHGYYALALLALSAVTSRMKVKLPGIDGNMSVNLPFLLTAVVSLSAIEAVAIASVATVVQCWPKPDAKFKPQQMVFNVSMMALASSVASLVLNARWVSGPEWVSGATLPVLATLTLFAGQTMSVAAVVALSQGEGKRVHRIWWNLAQLSFPYYVVSAGVTSMMQSAGHPTGWALALAVFPVMYGIHRSYRLYFGWIVEYLRPVGLSRGASAGA
ncbi:MAG: hypothetical protein WBQ08_06440 [Candidatus Sulfotelmatobacter sp.]